MKPLDDHNWQPATFLERGVAAPFTSPMLAGARIRPAERRFDLVVPHPAGARGVYIFAIASVAEFCTPTLHDTRLLERLTKLHPISPHVVRLAARAVAAEGAAGRAATGAALAAAELDSRTEQAFHKLLLQSLLRDGSGAGCAGAEQHLTLAVRKLSARTGRDADAVRADLGCLASLLAACGLGPRTRTEAASDSQGRCDRLVDTLDAMCGAMAAWAATASPAGLQVAASARAVAAAGRLVLEAAYRLLADPAALLGAWAAGPDAVAARLGRPDWLLDGWENICLLWRLAETEAQRAEAAVEAALLVPPMPPEVSAWLGAVPPKLLAALNNRHPAAPTHAGRPPSWVVSLVARNEQIRAMAA